MTACKTKVSTTSFSTCKCCLVSRLSPPSFNGRFAGEPRQRVQNAAAWMIFNLGRTEHVTPCLIQLHSQPVQFRITFNLCVMMHNIHVGKAPHYRSNIVQLTSTRVTRPDLRSSSNTASYVTPHLRTNCIRRSGIRTLKGPRKGTNAAFLSTQQSRRNQGSE